MRTVQDIVGSFLNSLHIIRFDIETDKIISQEALDTFSRLRQLAELDTAREKLIATNIIGIDYENCNMNKDGKKLS